MLSRVPALGRRTAAPLLSRAQLGSRTQVRNWGGIYILDAERRALSDNPPLGSVLGALLLAGGFTVSCAYALIWCDKGRYEKKE